MWEKKEKEEEDEEEENHRENNLRRNVDKNTSEESNKGSTIKYLLVKEVPLLDSRSGWNSSARKAEHIQILSWSVTVETGMQAKYLVHKYLTWNWV